MHARFEPLPPETNAPRPAETSSQAWHGLDASVRRDDSMFHWNDEDDDVVPDDVIPDDEDGLEDMEDTCGDRMSDCQDYEPESLEPFEANTELTETDMDALDTMDSLGSSYDDAFIMPVFSTRSRGAKEWGTAHGMPVYSGPQLYVEMESDED